jgi:hypothetical protein
MRPTPSGMARQTMPSRPAHLAKSPQHQARHALAALFLAAIALALTFVCAIVSASSPSQNTVPTQNPILSQEIQLTGDQFWVDTGIDVHPGERLSFSATGSLRYTDAKSDNSPDGLPRGFRDLLRILPFNDAGRGALIGRVGASDTSDPFLIGKKHDLVAPSAGRLIIGINQTASDTADGTYKVQITIYAPDASSVPFVARAVAAVPGVDNSLFVKIPRRISDKSGAPGDMVNFIILGSQSAMENVFKTAGWVKVDADVKETLLTGILASMSKESYLTMPMSPLYLFGRTQDYGWAHAEPIRVVASRNHLRLWKAAFTVNGQTLWVGAATHDIGFEHDQRSTDRTAITHKIDPNIDLERDYVEKTLSATGQVSEVSHFLPADPTLAGKTATGGSFHSNGQILILQLDHAPLARQ